MPSAIVIGSGFGGAVAACRLAQAGVSVTLLERGRRYDGANAGFPRSLLGLLWQASGGPYDIRPISEVQIVQAAGYGGGSLLYANVQLRVPADAFRTQEWPAGYSREALDPHYDLVAYMLDIKPITAAPEGLPVKTQRMGAAAAALGRQDQFIHPPLAVDFSGDTELRPNKFGVPQKGCIHCGECVIGCNEKAKNTLDHNYLAVAEAKGAKMMTECEVLGIEPRGGDVPGYRVRYRRLGDAPGETLSEEADLVFVCAGAVNSTELLLQCRRSGTLGRISARLGEGYSGNGDLLAFAFETDPACEPDKGPSITTTLVYDDRKPTGRSWFVLQEGGFPRELWPLVKIAQAQTWIGVEPRARRAPVRMMAPEPARDSVASEPAIAAFSAAPEDAPAPAVAPTPVAPSSPFEISDMFRQTAEDQAPTDMAFALEGGARTMGLDLGGMRDTMVFLAMGRDLANGRIEISPAGDVAVRWNVPSNLELYNLEERLIRDVAGELKGKFAENPFWRYARLPVSVHNLGGCRMADREADGVTDGTGEVFNYPGLFVLDGSILPGATGVNPSHTIAAVAERNIERIIRRVSGDAGWTAPERARATRFDDPMSRVVIPEGGTPPPVTPAIGVAFDERMTGTWIEPRGEARHAECRLRITITDLARFIDRPEHLGTVHGTIDIAGLTNGAVDVHNGLWNLFVAPGSGPEREMRYAMSFHAKDGQLHALHGTKVFEPHAGVRVWDESTTLDFHLYRGADRRGQIVGQGTMRIGIFGVVDLATSIDAIGPYGILDRTRAKAEFVKFFLETLAKLEICKS